MSSSMKNQPRLTKLSGFKGHGPNGVVYKMVYVKTIHRRYPQWSNRRRSRCQNVSYNKIWYNGGYSF